MPRIPRLRRDDHGDEPTSGAQESMANPSRADADESPARYAEPASADSPAGGEEGVRDAARQEEARDGGGGGGGGGPALFEDPADRERDFDAEAREREEREAAETGRVSVVREPQDGGGGSGADDEYQWHTGRQRPTGAPDAVEFIDTHKAFGRNRILRGLNMGIPEGKISMILGPSGTGKSVCIKHMVGLLYPDEGDVLVHGESVPNMPDDDLFEMRKKFGVLFQDGALFGSMNVFDNVAFPLRQHTDKAEEEVVSIVSRRLEEVGLSNAGDKAPNELSGGMRKRAGFARALVLDPDIVLFDEPDSGLDPVRTALLGELIMEIHADAMEQAQREERPHMPAFTLITHDIMTARRVAEYIAVLWKGRIVESGPAEELFNSDNPFVRQFLSGESQGPLGME
jgi:phospholipid/cholesterol/gamma-HCH transport system ATP-binding protein